MSKSACLNISVLFIAILAVSTSAYSASGKYKPFDDLYASDVKAAAAEGGDRLSVVAQTLIDAMPVNASDAEMLDALLFNALKLYLLSDKPDDLGALMRVALQKTGEYPSIDLAGLWKRLNTDIENRLRRERSADRRFTLCFALGLMDLELSRFYWLRSDAATSAAFRNSAKNHAKNTQNPILNDLSVADGDLSRDYIKKYAPALTSSTDAKVCREASERFLYDDGILFRRWYDGGGAAVDRPVASSDAFRFILKNLIMPARPFMEKSGDSDFSGFAAFCSLLADPALFNETGDGATTADSGNASATTDVDRIIRNWRRLPTRDLVFFVDFYKGITDKADSRSALKDLYKTVLVDLYQCLIDRQTAGAIDGVDFPIYFRASQTLNAELALPRPYLCSGALWSPVYAPGLQPFQPSAGVNALQLPDDNFEIEFRFTPALNGNALPVVHAIAIGDVSMRFQRTLASQRPDFILSQGGKTIVTKELSNYLSDAENSRLTIRCLKGRLTVAFENAMFADNVPVTIKPPKAPDATSSPTPLISWILGGAVKPISVVIRSFEGARMMER